MGYAGNTYQVQCDKGGLNFSNNHDILAPTAMVSGSKNLIFEKGGRRKRGGTSILQTAASGTPTILNSIQYTPAGGTSRIVSWTDTGKILHDGVEVTLPQTVTAGGYCDFEIADEELYFVNGSDEPMVFSAAGSWVLLSSFFTLTADWSATKGYPNWVRVHGRGNSRRLWMGGVSNDPEIVYGSKDGDFHNFTDEVGCIYLLPIDTGHPDGIVGSISFNSQFIMFSKKNAFILDDEAVDSTQWGYDKAPWEAGAAHQRLIVRSPNDIIIMNEDGDIYSIGAVQEANDYVAASLARPAFVNDWLRINGNFAQIEKFHSIYDPVARIIRFFIVQAGKSQVDTSLVYYIDRVPAEAWMLHDNLTSNSGFDAASSATVFLDSSSETAIMTGDYSGRNWRLETTSRNDNGNGYYAGFLTPEMLFLQQFSEENSVGTLETDGSESLQARFRKQYKRFIAGFQALGSYNISVNIWIDGTALTLQTLSMLGAGVPLGTFILGTNSLVDSAELADKSFYLNRTGKRIKFELFNSTVNEDFFVSRFQIDYKSLSKRST